MKKLSLLFAMLFSTALATDVPKLTPQEASQLLKDGNAVLVDVREPAECADTGVAAPAVLLPKSDFDGAQALWKPFLAQNGPASGKTIVLYCASGNRAGRIAAKLAAKGLKVANAGGFGDWQAAGLPVRKVTPEKK